MTFGFRDATATFRRALNIILSKIQWKTCIVHINDNNVIFNKNPQHVKDMDEVLTLLYKAGVASQLFKYHFFRKNIEYPGLIHMPGCLAAVTKNVVSVTTAFFQTNNMQMQTFLGIWNVYRKFIKDFSKLAWPLKYIV